MNRGRAKFEMLATGLVFDADDYPQLDFDALDFQKDIEIVPLDGSAPFVPFRMLTSSFLDEDPLNDTALGESTELGEGDETRLAPAPPLTGQFKVHSVDSKTGQVAFQMGDSASFSNALSHLTISRAGSDKMHRKQRIQEIWDYLEEHHDAVPISLVPEQIEKPKAGDVYARLVPQHVPSLNSHFRDDLADGDRFIWSNQGRRPHRIVRGVPSELNFMDLTLRTWNTTTMLWDTVGVQKYLYCGEKVLQKQKVARDMTVSLRLVMVVYFAATTNNTNEWRDRYKPRKPKTYVSGRAHRQPPKIYRPPSKCGRWSRKRKASKQ